MDLLWLWPYAAGYAAFIAAFNVIVVLLRPKWLGGKLIWVSAVVGPVAVVIVALLIANASDANSLLRLFVLFFAGVAFVVTSVVGALVSWVIFAWVSRAIEQEQKHSGPD
ncbi:MAG: hypothetical protein NT015_08570 [Alphaproteobacteria bacterium]|nr:hypothetical protein [Alphaproteobacteria bacterium]